MSGDTGMESIVGRVRREGNKLFRQWYDALDQASERGEPAANVFVMGSLAEILRVFDFHLVFPEINSLQTAVRKVSLDYLNKAEDYGFSPDVCAYVKADVGVYLSEMQHPMGRIPRPSLVVATNLCNTFVKWGEIWERFYGCPVATIDFPGMRGIGWRPEPGGEVFRSDVRYMRHQIDELIALCERVTGKRFDIDKLVEIEERVNRTAAAWKKILDLNKHAPAPFNTMTDGLTIIGVLNAFRGTEEGVRFIENVLEEMEEKIRLGVGATAEEKFRLIFVGTACYAAFRRFTELFEEWGGVFVRSEYLAYAGGGLDKGIAYDTSRPLDSLAEQLVLTGYNSMSNMFFSQDLLARWADEWQAEGIVYHAVKSCRTVSTGMADSREYLIRHKGVPCLLVESDLVDPRVWSEAQMKNRIDAFFEALASKKARLAGTG